MKVSNCLSLLVIRRFTCAENHIEITVPYKKKKKKDKRNTQNSCEEKKGQKWYFFNLDYKQMVRTKEEEDYVLVTMTNVLSE